MDDKELVGKYLVEVYKAAADKLPIPRTIKITIHSRNKANIHPPSLSATAPVPSHKPILSKISKSSDNSEFKPINIRQVLVSVLKELDELKAQVEFKRQNDYFLESLLELKSEYDKLSEKQLGIEQAIASLKREFGLNAVKRPQKTKTAPVRGNKKRSLTGSSFIGLDKLLLKNRGFSPKESTLRQPPKILANTPMAAHLLQSNRSKPLCAPGADWQVIKSLKGSLTRKSKKNSASNKSESNIRRYQTSTELRFDSDMYNKALTLGGYTGAMLEKRNKQQIYLGKYVPKPTTKRNDKDGRRFAQAKLIIS